MNLSQGFVNHKYVIDKINSDKITILKLKRMNVKVGSIVKIIRNSRYYPYLIEIEHNRIAFCTDLAQSIEVIPYV